MRRTLTRFFWLTCLVAALAVIPAAAQELKIASAVETNSIDPLFSTTSANAAMARHFFDPLVLQDEHQHLTPGLALSWRTVDPTTWEFRLRPGVKLHNGSDFTAEDVAFSLRRAPHVANSIGAYGVYTREIIGIEVVDALTIRLHTAGPYPMMPYDMSVVPMISHRAGEGVATADFNSGKAAIGTGPFRFIEWVPGDRLVMARNDAYWGPRPRWSRVTIKPIPNDSARVAALLAHDVDAVDAVPPSALADLGKRPDIRIARTAYNRLEFLHYDTYRDRSPFVSDLAGNPLDRNPLKDLRVRKAISKAIDRDALVKGIMEGVAVPAGQLLPEGDFGTSATLKPEAYDPAGAKHLLAEAGYPDGFAITLHGPNGRFVNDAKIAVAVGQMLSRVGIATQVETLPVPVFKSRAAKYEFSFYLDGWWADTGEVSSPLRALLGTVRSETGWGAINRGRYSNPQLDALIGWALGTIDDGERGLLLAQASEMAVADLGLVPLYYEIAVWATRSELTYRARADGLTLAIDVTQAP